MGTVSPSTHLSVEMHKQIMHEIVLPTDRRAWPRTDASTRACSTSGLMITEKGPKVLEFNARFGDPETQVIVARMKSDIVPILKGVAEGDLSDVKIEWAKDPAVCVVLAAKGYPDDVETGRRDPRPRRRCRARRTSSSTTPPPRCATARSSPWAGACWE